MSNTLSSTKVTSPENKSETVAHFSIDTPSTPFVMKNVVSLADDYVFSCFVKSDSTGSFKIGDKQVATSNKWTEVKIPFSVSSNGNPDIAIYFTVNGQYYFYHTQVERGEVPTKWQPSPDDVDEDIQSVSTTQQASIEAMPGKIMAQVAQQYATKSDFSQITQRADSISSTVTRVNNKVNDGSQIISTINQTAEDVSINANKINLNGVVTANNNFKILSDGSMEANNGTFKGDIVDKNGNKIVSTDGLKFQLMFVGAGLISAAMFAEFGFYVNGYNNGNTYAKDKYIVPFSIPTNFQVDSAILYCTICSAHWTKRNIYGFPHPIAIYIDTRSSIYLSHSDLSSTGSSYLNDNAGTKITNGWANGKETWTANCSNSFKTDKYNSRNLNDYIKPGTSGSVNLMVTDATENNDTYSEQRTGLGAAYLVVEGRYITAQ